MTVSFASPRPGVVVAQPTRGYRYGAEPFWLGGLALSAPGPRPTRVLDVGTGSGVIALLLAAAGCRVDGVDRFAPWAALWPRSMALSVVRGSARLCLVDARAWPEGDYDLVVSNPPFFAVGTGPAPADPWRAAGRLASHGALDELVRASRERVARSGRLLVSVPADQVGHACGGLRADDDVLVWQVGGRRAILDVVAGTGRREVRQVRARSEIEAGWYRSVGAVMCPEDPPRE
jgi:tRNA1(Val) A37 N6-methylase TrmN6